MQFSGKTTCLCNYGERFACAGTGRGLSAPGRGAADTAEECDPAWPQLIWQQFWCVCFSTCGISRWNVMKVGSKMGWRPNRTHGPLKEMIKESLLAISGSNSRCSYKVAEAAKCSATFRNWNIFDPKMPLKFNDSWMLWCLLMTTCVNKLLTH